MQSRDDTFVMPMVPEMAPGAPAVLRFGPNTSGRDFVVGDIHGMFAHLRQMLMNVSFDGGRDRLFSVGDLVDRGPQSVEAMEWLEMPWFHACRGNHEQFVLDSVEPEQFDLWVRFNGGGWWLELGSEQHLLCRDRFRSLPMAMEVQTGTGLVGIVHADVPPMTSWDEFTSLLEQGDSEAMLYSLWSRNRIQGLGSLSAVTGRVQRVYCGHTPTRRIVTMENVHHIDTGAVYAEEGYRDARLTMVEIHPASHVEHCVFTHVDGPLEPD